MINVNMKDKAGVTLATAGKYCADNVKVTPSAEILRKDEQAKTATPTTSAQDITPDAGKALSKVTVNPITAAIVGDLDADSFAPAIVAAVEGKGVTVPDGTLLDGMAALIESIEAGGGLKISIGTYTSAADTAHITVQHTLGVIPTFAFVCVLYGGSKNGLLMLFQNELTININHAYGNYLYASEPLTSAGSTEAKAYRSRAYGANESDISFGVNTTGFNLFPSGNTYQWIVGVTE